jgi:RNA polymerase sigma factor (sigma-70 family)
MNALPPNVHTLPEDAKMSRDPSPLNQFVVEHFAYAHHMAVVLMAGRRFTAEATAEDVAQNALLRVALAEPKPGDVRSDESKIRWAIKSEIRNLQRGWAWRLGGAVRLDLDQIVTSVDPSPSRRDTRRHVWMVLAKLKVAHREVLCLCELQGYTTVEAAEILGVPTGTVKSRLIRARIDFRRVAKRLGLDLDDA